MYLRSGVSEGTRGARFRNLPVYYLPHVLRDALSSSLTRSLIPGNAAFDGQ